MADTLEILVALQTNQAITAFNSMMGQFSGKNFAAIGGAMTAGITLPIVAGMGAATAKAVEFNSAMSNSARTLDLTKKETAALSKEILTMAPALGLMPTEFANVAAEAGKLGVAKDEVAAFGQVLAKLSGITDVPIGEFTKKAGAIKTIFQQNTAEFEKFGAAINALDDKIGGTTPNILEFTSRVGAVGKTMGLTANQVAAFGSVFESVGIAPERAGTAFQNFAEKLFTIGSATPQAKAAFESMGFSAATFGQSMSQDATGSLLTFLNRLNSISDPVQKSSLLIQIFGKTSSSEIATLATQTTKLSSAFKVAGDDTANLAKMQSEFGIKMQDPAMQSKVLQAQLAALGVQLGSVLVPLLSQALAVLTPLAQRLSAFLNNNPEWAKFFVIAAGGVAVIGPLVMAVGGMITAFTAIGGAVSGASAALAGLGGVTGALSVGFGGLGAAIAAVGGALISVPGLIAAAVAAVVALTFNIGGCRDALGSLASYLIGNIGSALNTTKNAFISLGNSVIASLAPIAAGAKANLEPVIAYISNVASQSKAALSMVISGVSQAVSGVGQAFNGVAQTVSGVVSTLTSTLNGMVNAAANSFQGVIGVVNNVKSAVSQAVSAVQNAVPQFFNSGASLMQSFAQGVASSAANAYNAVSDSVKKVRNLLPSSPAKEGPLKDLDKSGQALLGTFAANINGSELLGRLNSILSSLPMPNLQGNVSPSPVLVGGSPSLPVPVSNRNESQSVVINYSQTVNVSSQMSGTEIINSLKSAQGQFLDYLSRSEFFKNRKQS